MSQFQSYLVISQDRQSARAQTERLAKDLGINLQKASPDVFFITPPKKEIVIDQIRDLKAHIHQKPLQYKHKFVVIEMAHTMAHIAQNALLKVLEEPPAHAIIVLEANNKSQILPTIRSRTVILTPKKAKRSERETGTLLEHNLQSALEQVSQITDPEEYLDTQIINLSELLTKPLEKRGYPAAHVARSIEACVLAKEMIKANVNPSFTLANLAITIHSK